MESVMFRNYLFNFIYLSIFLCCSVSIVLADEAEVNTTNASGGNQIIVSPMNVLLDLGESGYANALVLDEDGNPVEGHELEVISQGEAKVAIEGEGFVTSESGYIYFSILGKQQGDTVVTVSDGIISTDIIFGGVWTNKGYLSLKRIDE